MKRTPKPLREAAEAAWLSANGDRKKAIGILKKSPVATGRHRWGRLIIRWGRERHMRPGHRDLPRSGRPSHLTQQDLDKAVEILKGGYMFGCVPRAFPSMPFACVESEELRDILERAKISEDQLLKRIKEAAPEIVYQMQHVKAAFNMRQKKARKSACRALLRKSDRYRKQIFWVDAKKMYLQASSMKAWLDSSEPIATIPDSRTEGRKALHFYAMVNACGGPVALKYVTGTSGLVTEQQYKVCSLFSHFMFHRVMRVICHVLSTQPYARTSS